MTRHYVTIVSVGAILALVLTAAITQVSFALSGQFYDDRAYSSGGDVVQGGANISGVVGSNQYVKRASVNFNVYFSGRTGQMKFQNFNFCPGVGGDNGTGNTFANGGNVTDFTVKYFRKNGSNPRQAIDASFQGKKNTNCGATETINVNFGNSLDPDPETGRYSVIVQVTQRNGFNPNFNIQNMFRTSASSSAGSARIAHKGGGDGSQVTVEQTDGSPANTDYRVRFGVDCSLPNGSRIEKIRMYDLDNGGGSGAQLNGKVSLRLQEFNQGSNSGAFVKLSSNSNMSGGGTKIVPPGKDDVTQDFYFKAKAGKRYVLFIDNVYYNNTLQFDTPYDGIFWETGCTKWDAKPESFVSKGRGFSKEVQQVRGGTVTFLHRVTNKGPGVATLDTRPQRNYNDNKILTGSFNSFDSRRTFTLASGEKKEIPLSFKIPTGRVNGANSALKAPDGSLFCQRYRINPGEGGGGVENSTQACVRVGTPPAQYDLNPNIQLVNATTYSYYPNLQVQGWVEPVGTVSDAHTWQMFAVRYDSPPNTATRSDSEDDVCDVVPSNDRTSGCDLIHNSAYSATTNSHTMNYTSGGPDDAGTYLCFITRVSNPTEEPGDDATWRYSNMTCAIAGVKPKIQVWGGNVKARGVIETSLSDIQARRYGSWGEYGVLSNGANVSGVTAGMGSGATLGLGTVGAGSPQQNWSNLTFGNVGSFGNFVGDLSHATVSQNNAAIYNDYEVDDIGTLFAIGTRRTIVVNGTLTISGDLIYPDTASSIRAIPRIVLIANNIVITDNVKRIDPWLAATQISTCGGEDGVSGFQPLTAYQLDSGKCGEQLKFNGPVIAERIYMYRTHDTVDGEAAEIFNLRADAFLSAYAGGVSSEPVATTSTVSEVPPRF